MFNHRLTHNLSAWLIAVLFLLLHLNEPISATLSELKHCPSPRSLCNRAEASKSESLDDALGTYFADEMDTALGGDRELVWWALAGGEEGRWWWEAEGNIQIKHPNSITKRVTQLNETEVEKEQRMARDKEEYESRQEEEKRQRGRERAREQKLREQGTNWPDSQRGFCCEEGFTCTALSMDSSLVYCFSERAFLVITPEKVLLDIQTLNYVYENDTTGNLRNYEVPRREEGVRYRPTKPTPIPIEVGSTANGEFPLRLVFLGGLAIAVGYLS
ncbi:hypothetical protein BGX38DRAFT_179996 [Terfezia claveryi]|nr:hypothetical protein BGX38DRAFT_179996 [Terfezia claveryi]